MRAIGSTHILPDAYVGEVVQRGARIASITSEPEQSFRDKFVLQTVFRRVPGGWHVAGVKQFCSLGDAADYLVEQMTANVQMFVTEIVGVDLPAAVELTITETEPGIQGDRVSGAKKPATLQTGLVIQVPLFVNTGDRVKVDTRTGEYITRV